MKVQSANTDGETVPNGCQNWSVISETEVEKCRNGKDLIGQSTRLSAEEFYRVI